MTANLPDAKTIRSKGFTIVSAREFVNERFGEESWKKVVAEIDPAYRDTISSSILASNWNPFELQVAVYTAVDRIFGKGDFQLCRDIGRFSADREHTTIHKATIKLGGLKIWMKLSSLMWNQYHSAGKMACTELDESGGKVLVTDFNPIQKSFCYDLAGWIERTMELAGKKNVTIEHPQCLLDGHPACVYEGRWTG
jgi:hypothetical protein